MNTKNFALTIDTTEVSGIKFISATFVINILRYVKGRSDEEIEFLVEQIKSE